MHIGQIKIWEVTYLMMKKLYKATWLILQKNNNV